ncbi:phosphoribosylanthranilate isomerase [Thiolapillus sp.]
MRTRVKICGITRLEDAMAAVNAGADALGFVFYPPSPRHIDVAQAGRIVAELPPFVTTVALFVDADRERIAEVVGKVRIDRIQFHGQETPAYCAQHGRPWIKAIRMKDDVDLMRMNRDYQAAAALLLDAYKPGVPGGTGEGFDWKRIPVELAGRIILAGGLDAGNVSSAVRSVRPYAVDVSGGVEISKGVKDQEKIEQFMRGVELGEK